MKAGHGQKWKRRAGDEDRAESRLPRHAHALDDGVGEIRVQAYAGGHRQRIAGDGSHEDAG